MEIDLMRIIVGMGRMRIFGNDVWSVSLCWDWDIIVVRIVIGMGKMR